MLQAIRFLVIKILENIVVEKEDIIKHRYESVITESSAEWEQNLSALSIIYEGILTSTPKLLPRVSMQVSMRA